MNVDHTQELTHISLCTGYGGIDLGLSRALRDVRTVAYVEIEAFAVENLVAKIENNLLDVAPVWSDLKTFPWELFYNRVDILSGGFPCQPFSTAGRRAGDKDPRHLFPYILDGLRELGRPALVFLENVEGIISSKLKGDDWSDPEGTPVLLHVLRELERLGYDATAGVFSAREVGATHQRKRVFIMGVRSDLGESGRALVSGMLERGGGADVEHAPSSRLQGSAGASVQGRGVRLAGTGTGEAVAHAEYKRLLQPQPPTRHWKELSKNRVFRAIYPAPRGAEQYEWEPPRVTVGDTRCLYAQNSIIIKSCFDPPNRNRAASLFRNAVLNRDFPRDTAYPAPRGAEQYEWEPPRVTVGDTEHARPPRAEERRSVKATSDPKQEAETGAGQPSRAGESESGCYLSSCSEGEYVAELGNARSGEQRSSELKPCLLSKQESEGETGLSQRASHRGGEVNRKEAQSSMGRNVDGPSCGMGYAELSESLDNRTDELRLLGNGVVPGTAERAFRELWRDLNT